METLKFIITVLLLHLNVSLCTENLQYKTKYFDQKVDHLDTENDNLFPMLYYSQSDHLNRLDPVYIYIAGEYAANTIVDYLDTGLVADLARETNGRIYILEHRYFGESVVPENEIEYEYLSVKQVLADIAHFIEWIKLYNIDSKVVVVGGSYAGRLAAWMRLKYPDLVDAAIASSAPLKNELVFQEYYEKVAEVYRELQGEKCLKGIQNKISYENDLLKSDSDEQKFKTEENICAEIEVNLESQKRMYRSMVLIDIASPVVNFDLEKIIDNCASLLSMKNKSRSADCYSIYLDVTGWAKDPYDYMRCLQLAQFPTSTESSTLPFEVPLEMYIERCMSVYSKKFDLNHTKQQLRKMDAEYGGLTPNVTQVVFVNGDMDPWHSLGVLRDLSSEAPAIFMKGTKHCEDLELPKPEDSQILLDGRERIKSLVKNWIGFRGHAKARKWSFFRPHPSWDSIYP